MKRFLNKKHTYLLVVVLVLAGVMCGGWWFLKGKNVSIANVENPTDEQMERFFEEYAIVTAQNDPENMLIVRSEGRPNDYGAKNVVEAPNHTYYLMYGSSEDRDKAYAELEMDGSIGVERNIKMQLAEYNSWGIEQMGLSEANSAVGYGGNSVIIAIIDTGLDTDLFQRYYPDVNVTTYDVETDSSNFGDMVDNNGHGTHVAGTIAEGAPKNTSIKVIRAVRGENDELYAADVTVAIQRARWGRADVINMSLGSYEQVTSQKEEINHAVEYDKSVVVAAAGNDGVSDVLYPAGYDNVVSVSALNQDLSFASYSNYGATIDYAAPGTDIESINGIGSGTSMATPHVTAAVAVLKSFNKYLSLDVTKNLLKEHTQDLGEPGWDERFGNGMIDYRGVEFCGYEDYCDQYGIFAVEMPVYTKMEIDEVTLTELNYYSISNLMLTEVRLYIDETNYETKKLQEVRDLTITGYDPEAYGLQEVMIACEGLSKTVFVVNPDSYTPGWEYRLNDSDQVLLTRYYDLKDYNYSGNDFSLTRLFVPEKINGKDVVAFVNTERTVINDDWSYETEDSVFERSSYASGALVEVYMPETLTWIDDETFWNFWSLEKVVMEADAIELGDWAFMNDSHLRNVEGMIAEMGEQAFSGDILLESIELKEGMTTIPKYAFSRCYTLTEIRIPSTVTVIDGSAFSDTKSLAQVIFTGGALREISGGAFSGAASLTEIVLPNGLETIGYGAFRGTALTSVQIPASVTQIGDGAFSDNDNFAMVTVDDGNTVYYDVEGEAVMYDYYSNKELVVGTRNMVIPVGTTKIGSRAFAGFLKPGVLVIPDTVEYIGSDAFFGCLGLAEVVIPRDTDIGYQAFERNKRNAHSYGSAPLNAKLWVYNNSDAYDYAVDRGFNYQTLDASYARVVEPFEPGDTLQTDTNVEFYYNYGVLSGDEFINHTDTDGVRIEKTVGQLVSVEYAGEVDCLRIGESYFMATYKDLLDKDAEMRVGVTVNGEYPEYVVPTGLTGKIRTNLSRVELPEGFSWMEDSYLWQLGEQAFMAKYTPGDTTVYAPIEIPVTVEVVLGRIQLNDPVIMVESKVYDGSYDIPEELVTISGLDGLVEGRDYYYYTYTFDNQVGLTTAVISIYLDSSIALDYGFGDDCSEYYGYYVYDYEILPASPELEVDNRTSGVAEVEVLDDGILVTAEKACTVIITRDGGETYSKVSAVATGEENTYRFAFEITDDIEVMVVLKGDGDLDGVVSSADSNLINRSLISSSLRPYRSLSDLEKIVFDIDGDGEITSADSNLINRSLISQSLRPYREITW